MNQPAPIPDHRMTLAEFITWYEQQPQGRFELSDGRVIAMSPERVIHSDVKTRAFDAIRAAIGKADLPCRAFPDGMAVIIEGRHWREPDVTVQSGGAIAPDDIHLKQPMIIVEVTSPSTGATDTGVKLLEYFSITSIRHYLVLLPGKRRAILHSRDANGRIDTKIVASGAITFDPPGFAIECSDLFPTEQDSTS